MQDGWVAAGSRRNYLERLDFFLPRYMDMYGSLLKYHKFQRLFINYSINFFSLEKNPSKHI
jgi:hypothetical protein